MEYGSFVSVLTNNSYIESRGHHEKSLTNLYCREINIFVAVYLTGKNKTNKRSFHQNRYIASFVI